MGRVQIFHISDSLLGKILCKPATKTPIIYLWRVWELSCVIHNLYSDFFKTSNFSCTKLLCWYKHQSSTKGEANIYKFKQWKILRGDDKQEVGKKMVMTHINQLFRQHNWMTFFFLMSVRISANWIQVSVLKWLMCNSSDS